MSTPGSHALSPETARRNGGVLRHDPSHVPTLAAAVDRARRCLLARQRPDGHWVGELQGDTILESEYVMLMAFLGREGDDSVRKAARYILRHQNAEGGWSNYPGGPLDLSVSVKAYFALKLAGHTAEAPYMCQAREAIRARGGAAGANSFSKFYLALLGQFPYANCPAVPPEMVLLPKWAYFNIYAMSSWTRTIVIPLSIFYAHKPVRRVPPDKGIAELFLDPPQTALWPNPPGRRLLSWTNFFLALDCGLKGLDSAATASPRSWWSALLAPVRALRRKAVQRAAAWMLEHFQDSDGVGAIFPPMIYTVICLRCLGYADDSAEMVWALKRLEDLIIEEGNTVRLQPCFSPVWDTALSLNALAATGSRNQPGPIARAARWLLEREVRRPGDWSAMNPGVEPGGWFFEYRNGFYPDTDDTAMVLMALARTGHAWKKSAGHGQTDESGRQAASSAVQLPAVDRALRWLMALQDSDGGWAAFDRDINREVLTKVPFADHNAMLDPSCPDITARVLEALGQFGWRVGRPQVDRAITFIRSRQDRRGCWLGRWGVNYIYGTWQVLLGLQAVHFDMRDAMVRRAVAWLKQAQQPCGGWGESCRSYDDPTLAGQGTPTASQTAWALLGLLAAGEANTPEVKAGMQYLVSTQQADGSWREDQFTGTGFPKVFYLKYHLYSLYFPLMALARYHPSAAAAPQRGMHARPAAQREQSESAIRA